MTQTADDPRIVELKAMGAHIGDDVFLGADVYIERDFAPLLTIEDGVVLARGVTILLHDSALNNVANEPLKFGRVTLHARCYVGANATILCGVDIGARSVVGACSLVTKDVPPGTVVAGQPARVTGSVADMIDKHKRERGNPRFGYLPLPAWRDRRHNPEQMQAAERIIGQFIRNFGNEH